MNWNEQKENQPTVADLQQQLAAALGRIEELEGVQILNRNAIHLQKEKVAQAVAACKAKDELITDACTAIAFYGEQPPQKLFDALSMPCDDSALKAWLGEPLLCREDGRCQYAIDHGAEGMGHCPEGKCCMPRYSPKGLK